MARDDVPLPSFSLCVGRKGMGDRVWMEAARASCRITDPREVDLVGCSPKAVTVATSTQHHVVGVAKWKVGGGLLRKDPVQPSASDDARPESTANPGPGSPLTVQPTQLCSKVAEESQPKTSKLTGRASPDGPMFQIQSDAVGVNH